MAQDKIASLRRPDAQWAAGSSRAQIAPEALSVLRNTYMLLAITLTFSAICAAIGIRMNFPYLGLWTLLPFAGFLFGAHKLRNSAWGLLMVFGLTGWLGLSLAPILSYYFATQGAAPIMLALGGTASIFFSLSAYVLVTQKDLSGWGRFLFIGLLVAFVAGIANFFLQISALSLVVSSMFIVISSGLIMYQTSAIIHGGERNYMLATISLYVMLYNIFVSLLHLIGIAGGD